mmetsp:Transcript_22844/g.45185  ORF Transcript_22844/g.45185 Transcript_22844/m.45185 type:complete len:206 (+) Transcript_22844:1712-2329(+)
MRMPVLSLRAAICLANTFFAFCPSCLTLAMSLAAVASSCLKRCLSFSAPSNRTSKSLYFSLPSSSWRFLSLSSRLSSCTSFFISSIVNTWPDAEIVGTILRRSFSSSVIGCAWLACSAARVASFSSILAFASDIIIFEGRREVVSLLASLSACVNAAVKCWMSSVSVTISLSCACTRWTRLRTSAFSSLITLAMSGTVSVSCIAC